VLNRREAILLAIFPSIALGLLNALYLPPLYKAASLVYWAADIFQYVAVPAAAYLFLVKGAKVRPSEFGFHRLQSAKDVGLVFVVIGVFWLFYVPVREAAYRYLWVAAPTITPGLVVPQQGVARWLVVTYFSLTAALIEEVAFRALPWLYFSSFKLRFWPYVLGTSLLFGAVHSEQGPHMVIATFSLGLVAAMLYAKIQNVWPFIIAHFALGLLSWSGNDF
jgi:Type II CAAX prenyl endopeptidase Rce1-like